MQPEEAFLETKKLLLRAERLRATLPLVEDPLAQQILHALIAALEEAAGEQETIRRGKNSRHLMLVSQD
jgi:hypothetical protein